MSKITIKLAETIAEPDGKGYVHDQSWHETYEGLIDADYLSGMTLETCTAIARKFPDNILVAKDGEKVVGFELMNTARRMIYERHKEHPTA